MSTTDSERMRWSVGARANTPPPEPASRPPEQSVPDEIVEAADEPTGFNPDAAWLTEALPPNVAMLCVTGSTWHGEPSFQLHFHYRHKVRAAARDSDLAVQRPSKLSLPMRAEQVERTAPTEQPWRKAYEAVMSWWAPMAKLTMWTRELIAADDNPKLIIWDNTDHEIPWELVHHRRSDGRGPIGWLGELVPIIRWTAIHDGERAWYYSAEGRRCLGGLLMMEDPSLSTKPDSFARYEIDPRTTTVDELMIKLDDPSHRFGLLLLRCHGKYSGDASEFTLGGKALNAYTEYTMDALRESGALVVLNACGSGRPAIDQRYHGAPTRSFAELFLRYGAGGVIATVGEVDLNHSHDFAVRLLENARAQDLNIAEALQQHRRYYAQLARRKRGQSESRTERDFELFFSSFMYVYFGHPDTVLRTDSLPRGGGAR